MGWCFAQAPKMSTMSQIVTCPVTCPTICCRSESPSLFQSMSTPSAQVHAVDESLRPRLHPRMTSQKGPPPSNLWPSQAITGGLLQCTRIASTRYKDIQSTLRLRARGNPKHVPPWQRRRCQGSSPTETREKDCKARYCGDKI